MKFHQLSPQTSLNWSSQQLKRPQIKLSELAKFTKLQIPQLEDSKKAMEYKQRQQQLLRQQKIKPLMKVLTKSQMLQGYLSMRPKHQSKSRSTSLLNKLSASSSKISLNETPKIQQHMVSEEKQQDTQPPIPTPIKPLRSQLYSSALDILRPETPINFRCLVQDVSIRKQKINTKKVFADIITKLTILKKLDIHRIDGVIWNNRPFQKKLSYEFLKACKNGDLATVKELLEQDRFLVFSFDYIHQTALHWAVKRSHTKVAQWILKSGCNVDEQDLIGRPPLYFAIEQQNAIMVKLLLEYNAIPWTTQRITYSKLCNEDLQIMLLLNKARKVHVIYRMVDARKRIQIKQRALTGLFDV